MKAEAPARLDLAGAWSDTPPITYECPGGSCVTNVAILVNGRKPIGAKCRVIRSADRTAPRVIKIVMKESEDDESSPVDLVFTHLDELKDYNKPQAVACLMKACLVFTKLVEIDSDAAGGSGSLSEQLDRKLGGSLELHTWTGLPHGSGLGTSSILAGCVLKALWRLMQVELSNESLSYAILVVEQIMTTSKNKNNNFLIYLVNGLFLDNNILSDKFILVLYFRENFRCKKRLLHIIMT